MAWTYLVASEDCLSQSPNGSKQSPTVKTTDTLEQSYWIECLMEDSKEHLSGMISKASEELIFQGQTLSSEVSPVRTSVLLDLVRAWKESVQDFSTRCVDWSKKSSPHSSSWKTSQPLELEVFERSLENLQIFGMTVDGRVYLPRKLEPLTLGKGGSYWGTPNTMDHMAPRSEEAMERHLTQGARKGRSRPGNLREQVVNPKYWPTPTANEGNSNMGGGAGKNTGKFRPSLGYMAKHNYWPTPTANMTNRRNSKPLNAVIGGKLNPQWVEWLMNFPLEWTGLSDWATLWFRSKQK